MNLTGFSTQLSDHIFRFIYVYFRHFSSQLHVLIFSECLNFMSGVLVARSERRGDKNKDIYTTVKSNLCKLRNLPRHSVQINWIWHYSFQEPIIETKNEINIPWMNSLVREWSKRMNGFDCKTWLRRPSIFLNTTFIWAQHLIEKIWYILIQW